MKTAIKFNWISINDIEQAHRGPWFSAGSKRFFNSRMPQYGQQQGEQTYFISSEKYNDGSSRLYTIRVQDSKGDIDTVGEFQEFETKGKAQTALNRILRSV